MTSERNTHWLLPWNCSFDSTFPDRETILSVLMFAEGQCSRVSNSQVCMTDGFCFAIIKVQRWYSSPVPLSKVPEFSVTMTEFEYDFQSRYSFIVPCCQVCCWADAEYTHRWRTCWAIVEAQITKVLVLVTWWVASYPPACYAGLLVVSLAVYFGCFGSFVNVQFKSTVFVGPAILLLKWVSSSSDSLSFNGTLGPKP